jgi:hypothetical protein
MPNAEYYELANCTSDEFGKTLKLYAIQGFRV